MTLQEAINNISEYNYFVVYIDGLDNHEYSLGLFHAYEVYGKSREPNNRLDLINNK